MIYTFKVNSVSYTGLIDIRVKQSIADYARTFTATMKDSDRTKRDAIEHDHDVEIWFSTDKIFKGKVEKKDPTRTKLLKIGGRDYSARFMDALVSANFSAQLSSAMIISLLSSYFPGEFTTTNVQTTTISRDRNIASWHFINFISELARAENWVWFVDTDKDVNFRPENFIDSGKHFSDAKGTASALTILDHGFKELSNRIINSVVVVYGASLDKTVIRNNASSIAIFKKRQKKEPNRSISTLAEAVEYGDYLLRKYENVVTPTPVMIKLDTEVEAGQIVYITAEAPGINDAPYLVLEVEHFTSPPKTIMTVGLATEQTSEILQELIRKMRNVEEQNISSTQTVETVDDIVEYLSSWIKLSVEKRVISGALAGSFKAGTVKAGQQGSAWTTVLDEVSGLMPDIGLSTLLDMFSQISTPNQFNSANSHILIGLGTTGVNFDDTILENESARLAVDPGFPRISGNSILFEQVFGEVELPGIANLREFGLVNNSVLGDLLGRYVHSANIPKGTGEEYKITWKLMLSSDNLTVAGLAFLLDIIAGFSIDYLDSSNASVEVVGSGTYRELVSSGYPLFPTTTKESLLYIITVANPGEYPTGGTITQVDLYNKTSSGIQVFSNLVDTIKTVVNEDNTLRYFIHLIRG